MKILFIFFVFNILKFDVTQVDSKSLENKIQEDDRDSPVERYLKKSEKKGD